VVFINRFENYCCFILYIIMTWFENKFFASKIDLENYIEKSKILTPNQKACLIIGELEYIYKENKIIDYYLYIHLPKQIKGYAHYFFIGKEPLGINKFTCLGFIPIFLINDIIKSNHEKKLLTKYQDCNYLLLTKSNIHDWLTSSMIFKQKYLKHEPLNSFKETKIIDSNKQKKEENDYIKKYNAMPPCLKLLIDQFINDDFDLNLLNNILLIIIHSKIPFEFILSKFDKNCRQKNLNEKNDHFYLQKKLIRDSYNFCLNSYQKQSNLNYDFTCQTFRYYQPKSLCTYDNNELQDIESLSFENNYVHPNCQKQLNQTIKSSIKIESPIHYYNIIISKK